MLLVRPPVSIFQQIILPYLSTATTAAVVTNTRRASSSSTRTFTTSISQEGRGTRDRRSLQTSASRCRQPDAAGESSYRQIVDWEPYEGQASSSRRRTREYLGLGQEVKDGTLDGEDGEDAYMRTTALALERIIRSHSPISSTKGKEKEVDRAPLDDVGPTRVTVTSGISRDTPDDTSRPDPAVSPVPNLQSEDSPSQSITLSWTESAEQPFPALIHQLLQARQFRLTTLHILNYPTYALDSTLVRRVAGYMDRHGGQAAARRLRKGKIPSPDQHDTLSQNGQDPLPDSTYSTASNDVVDMAPYPGGSLSPQARITAFYNTQLAQQLSSSHLSKGFRPPKSFPLPNTSLRQLRALLSRIHTLEQDKQFVPDRVTANLVLSCWVRSALAPPPDGVRVVLTRDKRWTTSPRHTGKTQDRFGTEEMRRLFNLVTRLFDRSAQPLVSSASSVTDSSKLECARTDAGHPTEAMGDPDLSYSRHIKPFVRIFRHGFKQQRDRVGLEQLNEWDDRIKSALADRREGNE